jgi:cyclic beta-1,2-glucan synthetase
MYRLIIESLLGLRLDVDKLHFAPCFPAEWTGFKVHYRFRETVYHITVLQSPDHDGEMNVTMDGLPQDENIIKLINDRHEHFVELTFVAQKSAVPS